MTKFHNLLFSATKVGCNQLLHLKTCKTATREMKCQVQKQKPAGQNPMHEGRNAAIPEKRWLKGSPPAPSTTETEQTPGRAETGQPGKHRDPHVSQHLRGCTFNLLRRVCAGHYSLEARRTFHWIRNVSSRSHDLFHSFMGKKKRPRKPSKKTPERLQKSRKKAQGWVEA